MLKRCIVAFILCNLLFGSVHAHDEAKVRAYIKKKFPANFNVSDDIIAQLSWTLYHDKRTNDLDTHVIDGEAYIEVSRAITRLYCAQLLRAGTMDAYNQFVAAQLAAGIKEPLTFASFVNLATHIQKLSSLDFELLEIAAVLPSVSLSRQAAALASDAMDLQFVTNDNLGFLASTLRKEENIYPLVAKITQNNVAAKKLLYILFPPQTNFRHMLYTEGGISMFTYLRTMIVHGFIDKSGLDLWYAHWIINIAGFRGHINQSGSLYLREPVSQAIQNLKSYIYEMLDYPNFNPLLPYLKYRARILGLENLPEDDKLFVTHLACLLRLYNVAEGKKLYEAVMQVPLSKRNFVQKYFVSGLHDSSQMYHMYLPALFGNALDLTKGDIKLVIKYILPLYNAVLQQAVKQNLSMPVSFYEVAFAKNLQWLLHSHVAPSFRIAEDGLVHYKY